VSASEASWKKVDDFARERNRTAGDVYGWSRLEREGHATALLLVPEDAMTDDFPDRIDDIELALKPIPPPRGQSHE
jgi:hypothetical protein